MAREAAPVKARFYGNESAVSNVYTLDTVNEVEMGFLKKLLGQKNDYEPGKRIRVCVECGMPVEDHKDWCAIYKEQLRRGEASAKTA